MKTLFEKKITYKALAVMYKNDFLVDHILGHDSASAKVKNVCAPLSLELIARLESTLDLLNMSKREFFEAAIIEALDKAEVIFGELDLAEHFDDQAKTLSDHGISVTTEKEGA